MSRQGEISREALIGPKIASISMNEPESLAFINALVVIGAGNSASISL
jgi:hypothetical protein